MSRTITHVPWRHRTDDIQAAHTAHLLTDPRTGGTYRFAAYSYPRAFGVTTICRVAGQMEGAARTATRDRLLALLAVIAAEGLDGVDDVDVPPVRHRHSARRYAA
jgi:hypothetical protein